MGTVSLQVLRKSERRNLPDVRFTTPASQFPSASHCPLRAIAVSSGRNGAGKSNIVINLAMAFSRLGLRVLIVDGDLGFENVHTLLGLTPKFGISHVLEGKKTLDEVLTDGPGDIRIVAANPGVRDFKGLTLEQKLIFLETLDNLDSEIDVLLIDTSAGISDPIRYFNLAAQEKIIVANPDPASISSAGALIVSLYSKYRERHFKVLANGVANERMGKQVFSDVCRAADHLLDSLSLDYLGSIPFDPCISEAAKRQRPVLEAFPGAPSSAAFILIANHIRKMPPNMNHGTIQFFGKRNLSV